jgi:hypothetical protein
MKEKNNCKGGQTTITKEINKKNRQQDNKTTAATATTATLQTTTTTMGRLATPRNSQPKVSWQAYTSGGPISNIN